MLLLQNLNFIWHKANRQPFINPGYAHGGYYLPNVIKIFIKDAYFF
jgi:hypothetical protein